jgi:hypothetical protein
MGREFCKWRKRRKHQKENRWQIGKMKYILVNKEKKRVKVKGLKNFLIFVRLKIFQNFIIRLCTSLR